MPITLPKSGTVQFGAKAYIWSTYGRPTGTGNGEEWNSIFAKCVAPCGVMKAGIGELVLAQDQTGIDGDIVINSGTLWLGHPGLYRQNGWAYGKWGASHPERIIGARGGPEDSPRRARGATPASLSSSAFRPRRASAPLFHGRLPRAECRPRASTLREAKE